ncbi:cobyric acid synthase [Thalassobius sp. I31.1]|uniref:cobyric acid synthase n=1 Tax=Thalassobius sp. I31.1 TaxID=2109912 RepID=UPI000D1A5BB6|nr:cobyric acid synthase [Thalassobius sp. I31.1]
MTKALMIQGTGSNVGKSMLVAGLCRAAVKRGLNVRPFKPQNMSNNAAVVAGGNGEIGRAQALQALACGVPAHVDMNPILLKPESDQGAAVIVNGQHLTTCRARDYARLKPDLMQAVLDSFDRLKSECDLVIIEGAGSPAEVNLRANDIANMGFACTADVPVILAGDIDRGGVIAQMVGTQAVLDAGDEAQVAGFMINKFRGDPRLFDDGYQMICDKTNWPGFGVLPWFDKAGFLPAEDALDLRGNGDTDGFHVVCLGLSRIANFDDLDPIGMEDGVRLTILKAGEALPADTDLVIIPGTKSTRQDLAFLRAQGWDVDIQAHVRRGGHVLGICGGYQMLGTEIDDPHGIEGPAGSSPGLGLLNVKTVMSPEKTLTQVTARHLASGSEMTGYEIHIGETSGPDRDRAFANIGNTSEGAASENGRICGTYLHGLFAADAFRKTWLSGFGVASDMNYGTRVEETLDALAAHMEEHLDLDGLFACAR